MGDPLAFMNSTFIIAKLNSAQSSVTALVRSSLELLFLGRAIVKLGASSKMHPNSEKEPLVRGYEQKFC